MEGFTLDIQSVLLITGIVLNSILGFLIFAKKRSEFVNQIYVLNILFIIWWSVSMVVFRTTEVNLLFWTKLLYITPTLIASTFLYFCFFFPEGGDRFPSKRIYVWAIFGLNAVIAALTAVTGPILVDVARITGSENVIAFGPLYFMYSFYISGFFTLGLLILARKLFFTLTDPIKRVQLIYLLTGYLIASTLAMITNLVLPYFGYYELNWLGQVLTVFMVLPVTYAIFKHRLFEVKVIGTELITISLWIFLLVRALLETDPRDRILDFGLLAITLVVGWLLIRSVTEEVRAREQIEKQEKELEVANQQQESLLHFISHEVKGYLAKSEAAFAAIVAKDYGDTTPQLDRMAHLALADTRMGVTTVMNILDASNLKRGTVSYQKEPFDLVRAVVDTVEELRPSAEHKGLALQFHKPVTGAYTFTGDEEKIRRHVIRNLIDNSIKYTPHGEVRVELSRNDQMIRLVVSDTGVGITPDDMEHLFTEGGHGKNSIRVNVHSTGYGLFIAKQIAEGHGGTIRAESEGEGKGARFIVELPIKA